jgi:hypothetical protein
MTQYQFVKVSKGNNLCTSLYIINIQIMGLTDWSFSILVYVDIAKDCNIQMQKKKVVIDYRDNFAIWIVDTARHHLFLSFDKS